ncbi:MAG: FtsQ-type POTRA domain-containing protein [Candidatus Eisenbacteria bacterium]
MTGAHPPDFAERALPVRRWKRRRPARTRTLLLLVFATAMGASLVAGGGRILDEATRIREVVVTIEGSEVLGAADIEDLLGIAPGASLRRLDVDRLRERLLALPRVSDVRIRYSWFQRLEVGVSERVPVAMTVGSEGGFLEVALDGVLLAPVGECAADLPLLSWEERFAGLLAAGELLDLHGGPDLMALLHRIQTGHPLLWQGVSEAHLLPDGTYELYWSDSPTVIWGRGPISDARLRAWTTIMMDLQERGERDAVVDLRFREQIVVRLAETTTAAGAGLG